jgi:hypothetical protein
MAIRVLSYVTEVCAADCALNNKVSTESNAAVHFYLHHDNKRVSASTKFHPLTTEDLRSSRTLHSLCWYFEKPSVPSSNVKISSDNLMGPTGFPEIPVTKLPANAAHDPTETNTSRTPRRMPQLSQPTASPVARVMVLVGTGI